MRDLGWVDSRFRIPDLVAVGQFQCPRIGRINPKFRRQHRLQMHVILGRVEIEKLDQVRWFDDVVVSVLHLQGLPSCVFHIDQPKQSLVFGGYRLAGASFDVLEME